MQRRPVDLWITRVSGEDLGMRSAESIHRYFDMSTKFQRHIGRFSLRSQRVGSSVWLCTAIDSMSVQRRRFAAKKAINYRATIKCVVTCSPRWNRLGIYRFRNAFWVSRNIFHRLYFDYRLWDISIDTEPLSIWDMMLGLSVAWLPLHGFDTSQGG